MPFLKPSGRGWSLIRILRWHSLAVFLLALGLRASAQEPSQPPAATPNTPPAKGSHARSLTKTDAAEITEDDVKRQLEGKSFYLRSGYLENSLRFNYQGQLMGSAPQTSYTLSVIEIHKVHLSKARLEIEGIRYGLHFQSAQPTEDPIEESEKVRVTPKKKVFRIVIFRENKGDFKDKGEKTKKQKKQKGAPPDSASAAQGQAASGDAQESLGPHGRANQTLETAIDHVLAAKIDDRMLASLPDYWQFYFKAAARKSDYKPSDPAVLRQSAVDQKARLLSTFDPPSNEYAQSAGVVGVAAYHVVVTESGRPGEIAIARPIGVGLDENAVASIRKASFAPALKNGKPVPVVLDVLVQFRIYSKATGAASAEPVSAAATPQAAPLPGPYSVGQPAVKPPQ